MKDKENQMNKGVKILGLLAIAFFILTYICKFVELPESFKVGIELFLIFSIIGVFLFCFLGPAIKAMKHNLNDCDEEIFKEIDKFKKGWNQNDKSYARCIKKIKTLYQENGKIDELLKNNQIGSLFRRKSFLVKREKFYPEGINLLIALVISIIASFICSDFGNDVFEWFEKIIVGTIGFFLAIGIPYYEKGEDGSYENCLIDLELSLIEDKIMKYYKDIESSNDGLLDMQQIVINILSDLAVKAKRKNKEAIINDIEMIENLDLPNDILDNNVQLRKIMVGNHNAYLAYDKEKGKENNYIGNSYLISESYSKILFVMEKYGIITYLDLVM